jgi:hypothetical protein
VVMCMTMCEINNTSEMCTKFSLLECKLSEKEAIERIRLGESQAGRGERQAATDQVPVCWSLGFQRHKVVYT